MGQAGCAGCAEARESNYPEEPLRAAMNLELDSPRTYRRNQTNSASSPRASSSTRPPGSSGRASSSTAVSASEAQRLVARSRISEACAGDDEAAIREAIRDGEAAHLSKVELELAAEAAARAGSRTRARRALKRAVAGRNEDELREALTQADRAHLDASEVEEASNIIEELELERRIQQVRRRPSGTAGAITLGARGGQPGRPADAEDAPEGSSLPTSQPVDGLDEASRRRAEAVEKLEGAIRSRGQQELIIAIAEAETVGLGVKRERALLSQARVLLNMVNARRLAAKERRQREGQDEQPADDLRN